jgi:hypothetical protein
MNYSLLGADRSTQLKIAVVALVAVVAVVVVGANARLGDTGTGAQARINDIVVKAGKPVQYTIRDISTIQ